MPKLMRVLLVAGAAVGTLVAVVFALAVWMGARKLERAVDVRVVPVAYAKDAAPLKLGKYLFESRGCGECHGMDGRGKVLIDKDGMFVRTPNITAGNASTVVGYGEADWVRTIRHGVNPKGHALFIMPSEDYNRMNDADFAALVAYIRSLPPADGVPAEIRLPLMVKALYGVGVIPDSAEKIDHRLPPSVAVPVAASVEHGAYVANMCVGCHGTNFSGGPIVGGPPDWPPAANLTKGEGSIMGRYDTLQKFQEMLRTGKRPDGGAVDKAMPFESLRNMNEVDVSALYAYLPTLPPRKTGSR